MYEFSGYLCGCTSKCEAETCVYRFVDTDHVPSERLLSPFSCFLLLEEEIKSSSRSRIITSLFSLFQWFGHPRPTIFRPLL